MEKLTKYEDGKHLEISGEELEEILQLRKDAAERKLAEEQALKDAEIAKAALLNRLGITEDEAKLLLA
jgi:hypothetical protein